MFLISVNKISFFSSTYNTVPLVAKRLFSKLVDERYRVQFPVEIIDIAIVIFSVIF